MPQLDAYLPDFFPEVQALTLGKLVSILVSLYGVPCELPAYIPLVGFSKPTWILATFLTYSFYHLTHCIQICHSNAQFIQAIFLGQQFDIKKVIINIITPFCDYSFLRGALSFRLLISYLLEHVGLEIDTTQRV